MTLECDEMMANNRHENRAVNVMILGAGPLVCLRRSGSSRAMPVQKLLARRHLRVTGSSPIAQQSGHHEVTTCCFRDRTQSFLLKIVFQERSTKW